MSYDVLFVADDLMYVKVSFVLDRMLLLLDFTDEEMSVSEVSCSFTLATESSIVSILLSIISSSVDCADCSWADFFGC